LVFGCSKSAKAKHGGQYDPLHRETDTTPRHRPSPIVKSATTEN
jgi:hypothetical protein